MKNLREISSRYCSKWKMLVDWVVALMPTTHPHHKVSVCFSLEHFLSFNIFKETLPVCRFQDRMKKLSVHPSESNNFFSAVKHFLNDVLDVFMPPNQHWSCTMGNYFLFTFTLISTLIIICMTFDRFYSIILPHRASSLNTVKRAKITILCIVVFSFFFNIPHWFLSTSLRNKFCQPFHLYMNEWFNGAYFWLYMVLTYAIPFVCLLIMNSCIIYTVHKSVTNAKKTGRNIDMRSKDEGEEENYSRGVVKTGNNEKLNIHHQRKPSSKKEKSSEVQVYFTLLSVTFAFLILTFPTYAYFFYTRVFSGSTMTPRNAALFYFVAQIAHKCYYVNNGINFFLYVISGKKFRRDVLKLFCCHKENTLLPGSRGTVHSQVHSVSSNGTGRI